MTRRLNFWLLACLVVCGFPFYWYLIDPGPGNAQPKPVTMEQLRTLAGSVQGPPPNQVRTELIGYFHAMRARLVSGWGVRPVRLAVRSYELVVPGEAPIVIDAGTSRAVAAEYDMDAFNQSAQNRVNAVLAHAGHVVLLQNGPLHNGGRKVDEGAAKPESAGQDAVPYALAPGVVVIPAPRLGHDAKLVYVRLQNGRELLFTGPAAKVGENLRSLRPASRLAARWEIKGYRAESRSWLTTINALQRAAPDMTVVTAHDFTEISHAEERFSDYSARD